MRSLPTARPLYALTSTCALVLLARVAECQDSFPAPHVTEDGKCEIDSIHLSNPGPGVSVKDANGDGLAELNRMCADVLIPKRPRLLGASLGGFFLGYALRIGKGKPGTVSSESGLVLGPQIQLGLGFSLPLWQPDLELDPAGTGITRYVFRRPRSVKFVIDFTAAAIASLGAITRPDDTSAAFGNILGGLALGVVFAGRWYDDNGAMREIGIPITPIAAFGTTNDTAYFIGGGQIGVIVSI